MKRNQVSVSENISLRRIGRYTYMVDTSLETGSSHYDFGMYSNDQGHRAIAKIWNHSSGDASSGKRLSNEIGVFKSITRYLVRHPEVNQEFSDIRFVEYIDGIDGVNEKYLLTEYIDGKNLEGTAWSERKKVYCRVLRYLAFLAPGITQEEGSHCARRDHWFLLALLPAITVGASIKHPKLVWDIVRGALTTIRLWPAVARTDRGVFAHRDLGERNILRGKDGIYRIIDLELGAITHPLFDLVALSLKIWSNPVEGRDFIQAPEVSAMLGSFDLRSAYRALAIHLAIYNLVLNDGRNVNEVISFLGFQKNMRVTSGTLSLLDWIHLWFDHFKSLAYAFENPSNKPVSITSYDPEGGILADDLVQTLKSSLPGYKIHLLGSVSMRIAGRKDIDVFIECAPELFSLASQSVIPFLGDPVLVKKDFWQWRKIQNGWEIDVLTIDPCSEKFRSQTGIVKTIAQNPELLRNYELLKFSLNGKSLRRYEWEKEKFLFKVKCLMRRKQKYLIDNGENRYSYGR